MTVLSSYNPATGEEIPTELRATTTEEVDQVVTEAQAAMPALAALGREGRARLLEAMADRLQGHGPALVETAMSETGLARPRLEGEVGRTTFQLCLFAEAVREGSFLEAAIDHAGQTPLGPAPDVRRMLVPLGPVAVFGASNFPLAFSVPGGDTASAVAAGCPVVVKAHESHPLTSQLAFDALRAAVEDLGLPPGTIGLVHGREAGASLVAHPLVKAVGFTGSPAGGRALLDLVNARPEPIPFYGELGSLNPLVVTLGAAAARGAAVAEGLAASITGSGGQLCTKPGLVFVPAGEAGDRLVEELAAILAESVAQPLLNVGIASSYREILGRLAAAPGVTSAVTSAVTAQEQSEPAWAAAGLLVTGSAELPEILEECFGPAAVVVRYADEADLVAALKQVPGSLTASLHSEPDESALTRRLVAAVTPLAGRLVFNGFPTGVRVSWAQHHGGPWPSTNTLHTSVGVTAMRRFLRPLVWQDAPEHLLPDELRDGHTATPRRIDGTLHV
ncbi:aldehyde dehydrogenase (NADP(+)) [Nocardioides sp. NPDC057577]|uniref:aldehyde dehydrogenase (NADP(+)) n=1 Tax=Nocardioides sp. NPDC057577 TaxID=3346171 RepID=UPI00366D5B82